MKKVLPLAFRQTSLLLYRISLSHIIWQLKWIFLDSANNHIVFGVQAGIEVSLNFLWSEVMKSFVKYFNTH